MMSKSDAVLEIKRAVKLDGFLLFPLCCWIFRTFIAERKKLKIITE